MVPRALNRPLGAAQRKQGATPADGLQPDRCCAGRGRARADSAKRQPGAPAQGVGDRMGYDRQPEVGRIAPGSVWGPGSNASAAAAGTTGAHLTRPLPGRGWWC